jgi:predicted HicB family RNase H-like nuclease
MKNILQYSLDPSLHQRLVTHATDEGKTLNAFIKDTLEKAVSETHA